MSRLPAAREWRKQHLMLIETRPIPQQRSRGSARVALALLGGTVRLRDLRQEGSARAFCLTARDRAAEVVFVNTAGGVASGDRLSFALELGPGARACATTQAAERIYRAAPDPAEMDVSLKVGAGGWVYWLPQETILYDSVAARRRTTIDLSADAGCLALETIVLGRAARGEQVRRIAFSDQRLVRRDGRTLHVDALALDPAALGPGPALLGGARALTTLVLVAREAGDCLAPLRRVLDEPGVDAAASAMDGRLVMRARATDFLPLRRQIMRVLAVLRRTDPPRVWQ